MVLINLAVKANNSIRFAPAQVAGHRVLAQYMRTHKKSCCVAQALACRQAVASVAAYLHKKLHIEALGAFVLPHSNGNDAAQQRLHLAEHISVCKAKQTEQAAAVLAAAATLHCQHLTRLHCDGSTRQSNCRHNCTSARLWPNHQSKAITIVEKLPASKKYCMPWDNESHLSRGHRQSILGSNHNDNGSPQLHCKSSSKG